MGLRYSVRRFDMLNRQECQAEVDKMVHNLHMIMAHDKPAYAAIVDVLREAARDARDDELRRFGDPGRLERLHAVLLAIFKGRAPRREQPHTGILEPEFSQVRTWCDAFLDHPRDSGPGTCGVEPPARLPAGAPPVAPCFG